MKKTILLLGIILIAVFVLLTFLDNSEYALEKKLWKAQRDYEEIAKDPKAVPDESFAGLIDRYRKIVADYPDAKLTPKIHMKIGSIFILKKDYAQARASFLETVNKYKSNPAIAAEGLVQVGRTYEQEENPEEAIKAYQRVMAEYPLTEFGMNAPLYIANYLFQLNKVTDGKNALHGAVIFYKNVITEHPGSMVEFSAMRMLSATYFAQKDWKSGINTLGDLLLKFSKSQHLNSENSAFIVKSINTIAVANLQDYDLPVKIYRTFIAENPGHPFNAFLEKTIAGLVELKGKEYWDKVCSDDSAGPMKC